MADKLLIPCLYLQSGKAVTGFGQRNLFGEGNIEDLVRFYRDNGADELLVFDFSSGDKEHDQAIANIPSLEKAKVQLYEFSTQEFSITPTELTSKYNQIPLEELVKMLAAGFTHH